MSSQTASVVLESGTAARALHGAWRSVTLSPRESDELAAAAASITIRPDEDFTGFRSRAIEAWGALEVTTQSALRDLAVSSGSPVLFIKGLPPVRGLPPTPTTGQATGDVPNADSEFLLTLFTSALGLPISYLDQRKGRLTHDLYPTRESAEKVSSQSSSVDLGHHTEMFFHPQPPDFLALHCLRADPEGTALTGTASVEDILGLLSREDAQTLTEPLFAADLASLHGVYTYKGHAIHQRTPRPAFPVLGDQTTGGRFRFEPALTTALTARAETALANAVRAAEKTTVYGHLAANSMAIFDNRRVCHARTRFNAKFDGTDRWLRRTMIGIETGYHQRHDLGLVEAWDATGAVMGTFPYSVEQGTAS